MKKKKKPSSMYLLQDQHAILNIMASQDCSSERVHCKLRCYCNTLPRITKGGGGAQTAPLLSVEVACKFCFISSMRSAWPYDIPCKCTSSLQLHKKCRSAQMLTFMVSAIYNSHAPKEKTSQSKVHILWVFSSFPPKKG